jgi:hypothetical protein
LATRSISCEEHAASGVVELMLIEPTLQAPTAFEITSVTRAAGAVTISWAATDAEIYTIE